ncbi:AMP-binding protein [Pseudonocardia adelaidensis]|uniref:Long-chain fatty acid--CoA ligase n=1 Tax=Pseudonocardia adelaidensis TaxID=648754 RepID=A0ABP9NPL2_9PSEU
MSSENVREHIRRRNAPPRPPVDLNPASALRRHASYRAAFPVLRYAGGNLTYGELNDRAARCAASLAASGTGRGDRIAYLGMNSTSFVVTMFAAFRLGAVFVPVNFRLAEPELQQVLRLSGATTIVAEEDHRGPIEAVRGNTVLQRFLLVDDDSEAPAHPAATPWEPWSSLLATATPQEEVVPQGFDDLATLMFTSGTTGLPKGVMLTHGNLWWSAVNADSVLDTRPGEVTHVAAPLFHAGAFNSFFLRTITRGGTVVVRRAFDPRAFLDDLVAHDVNSFFAVPVMLAALAQVPGIAATEFGTVRSIVVAGAPVPPALIAQFATWDVPLQQAWGLTETAPFATHLPVERAVDKAGSAGVPMPYTEVRVVDPATNQPVAAQVRGEIVVRGPNVTPGYWDNTEATAAAFDDAGWFHSGDIGYFDADGYLYIVDRLKDMIISGGENVYPAEVEQALWDLSTLADVAVVGRPDERWGEAVVAVVAPHDGADVTLEQIRGHAAAKLARYKLPRDLRIMSPLPRNASGKLDKREISRRVRGED